MRSPEIFVELVQKVEVLTQTVNGLVTVNERLISLLTEAFSSVGEKTNETATNLTQLISAQVLSAQTTSGSNLINFNETGFSKSINER